MGATPNTYEPTHASSRPTTRMLTLYPLMHEMLPKRPASLLELIADAMDSDDDDHSPLLRYVCDKAPPSKTAHARIKRQRSNVEDLHLWQDEHGYHLTLAAPGLCTNDLILPSCPSNSIHGSA